MFFFTMTRHIDNFTRLTSMTKINITNHYF